MILKICIVIGLGLCLEQENQHVHVGSLGSQLLKPIFHEVNVSFPECLTLIWRHTFCSDVHKWVERSWTAAIYSLRICDVDIRFACIGRKYEPGFTPRKKICVHDKLCSSKYYSVIKIFAYSFFSLYRCGKGWWIEMGGWLEAGFIQTLEPRPTKINPKS